MPFRPTFFAKIVDSKTLNRKFYISLRPTSLETAIQGKGCGLQYTMERKTRTEEDFYIESRRLRAETMLMADSLKDAPIRFTITNGIEMDIEITKSDLKTIVSKNTQNNRFNAFKNKLAQDIKGFLEKAHYEGWREVVPGKHPETAYFAYYSRELGTKAYLCVRKIKNTGLFKPYAIIDQDMFDVESINIHKEKPLN